MKNYCRYISTNKNNTVLYVGVTNNLTRRIWEHKSKLIEGFTKKYNVNKLVYFESFDKPSDAIKREKQLKAGSRKKKIELINKLNPEWKDLYNFEIIYS
jgi:putative endonuclease